MKRRFLYEDTRDRLNADVYYMEALCNDCMAFYIKQTFPTEKYSSIKAIANSNDIFHCTNT